MFMVCLECYEVIKEVLPIEKKDVLPRICPRCRKRSDRALKRLGVKTKERRQSGGNDLTCIIHEK